MLQALLEERFKVKLHRETREVPVYIVTVARGGPKLQPFQEDSCVRQLPPPGPQPELAPGQHRCANFGRLKGRSMDINVEGNTVENFSKIFLRGIGPSARPVIDRTGLTGQYVFHLEYGLDEDVLRTVSPNAPAHSPDQPEGPSIFTAVQEQLGLKLDPGRGPGQFLIIDAVERPSPN